jgi:2-alkyl-3-oxoalkanoate reductase
MTVPTPARHPGPGPGLARTVIPPPIPADAARVVLIGAPSPLRGAVARRLRASTALMACLDSPRHLPHILSAGASGPSRGLEGAAVVLVAVPRPPGQAPRLRPGYRPQALAADFEQAAMTARSRGAARVIALSSVFLYRGSSQPLSPGSPTAPAAETASAEAAERAARLFTSLGGHSVVLRLGWACDRDEAITSRVLAAARRGWRLIDGDPGAWAALIAQPDAASAVPPALTVPPGIYNITDGCPCTQAELNAHLAAAAGGPLHPLDDPRWGCRGILFGHSRRIADTSFSDITGWQPTVPCTVETMAGILW